MDHEAIYKAYAGTVVELVTAKVPLMLMVTMLK